MFDAGAIILAGGKSSRMGSPKAALDWHGSTLLRRVTGLAQRTVDGPVVVVRAAGQELPSLHPSIEVVSDAREGRGPLQGLAAGLAALAERAEVAYVSSTDVPLLHPAFIRRVIQAFTTEIDVVLPEIHGFRQPLSAAYRTALLPQVEALIAADKLKPAFLFDGCRVLRLDDDAMLRDRALSAADPELASVRNLNEPGDYAQAQALPAPEIEVRRFGTLAVNGAARAQRVGAWTLGQLADSIGLVLDEHVVAALNGDQISRDRELPLAAGDTVGFMVADAGG
ncbi:MAG TPA: NTP transferase domain-containing protein [Solirubrobacteraceae bacterium]|nr:NTP transferase domain-containing protein [Solirubrobacteraceae bacterium]